MALNVDARYLEVQAEVLHWDDSVVNGEVDVDGTKIPFRDGKLWKPVIDLANGTIVGWPKGIHAFIYYEVGDRGEYWLQDWNRNRIAKWNSSYVPDELLAQFEDEFGESIIMEVMEDGFIGRWGRPYLRPSEWKPAE